jgi:tRNA pseudouridine38-40 synthase
MPRYALMVEYDGAPFAGWQRQADQPSVQGALEAALAVLEQGCAVGRGGGAHGCGRACHGAGGAGRPCAKDWDPFRLAEALNWHLKPAPVAVVACAEVSGDWHARFSAVERRYTYRVISRRAPLVEGAGRAWHLRHPLEVGADAGRRGASLGRHDFTTFRASICQAKSPVKTLDRIEIEEAPLAHGRECASTCRRGPSCTTRCGPSWARWSGSAPGPGTPGRVAEALAARDRAACGPVAPPEGLCLTGVGYPEDPFASGWREA